MPSISLVLPALNEADNIEALVSEAVTALSAVTDDFEIVLVDDGSRDATAEVTRRLMQTEPHLRLVQHEVNRGFGAAVLTGFTSATKDWIFYTDADRQFVLDEIVHFIPCTEQAELIAGYRAPRRDPFLRVFYGKGWSLLCTLLFGYTVRDVDCGFKLLSAKLVHDLAPKVQARGATFSIEWLVRAKRAGYRFVELPVTHRPRQAGHQTGAKPKVIIRAFRELVKFRLQLWSGRA